MITCASVFAAIPDYLAGDTDMVLCDFQQKTGYYLDITSVAVPADNDKERKLSMDLAVVPDAEEGSVIPSQL